MINRFRLQNYMSFGRMQTAELEAITVIVGANNSGKTGFLRLPNLVRAGNSAPLLWHRPPYADGQMIIEWEKDREAPQGRARFLFQAALQHGVPATDLPPIVEEQVHLGERRLYKHGGRLGDNTAIVAQGLGQVGHPTGFSAVAFYPRNPHAEAAKEIVALLAPVANARYVHLRVENIRGEAHLVPSPGLDEAGTNLAPTIAHWLLAFPEKIARFNTIMADCIPELRQVLAENHSPGKVRLLFEQRDGQRFDSTQVSDGVLVFAGLIAHALEAPPDTLMMIEEPERGVHPQRLAQLVDLLRTLVRERGSQFILATHSPVLLNQFRSEPEAILMFRRSPDGTLITRLADTPDIAEKLSEVDPGDMLASGAFNEGVIDSPLVPSEA